MSDAKRFVIATLAMGQSLVGAHYLKGARGGVPDEGPAVGRSVKLKQDSDYDTVRVNAAANSLQTCYGRWQTVDGFLLPPTDEAKTRLKKYLADNKGKPMGMWPFLPEPPSAVPRFYPRRLAGAGSSIAVGEDCRGKRHFDCIGFIFWLLHEVAPSITWENHGIPGYASGFTQVQSMGRLDPGDTKYGDIVVRTDSSPQHIGVISFGNKVVHASMESIGVVTTTYNKNSWTGVSRVKDGYL